jgi:glutaconyl-CoA/methylmalonyl-CoA decarboxylase subunit gamma
MAASSSSQYQVTVDGRARAVTLDDGGEDGRLRISVDGRERTVDARALGKGWWSIVDGNTARLLHVSGTGAKVTVEVGAPDGEPRTVTAEVAAARSAAATAGAGGADAGPAQLHAPIPGRLVKILVKAGDRVSAGQPLLVLEAMKMENEVRAPRAGTVKTVHAAEGVAVEASQLLVSLE